MEDLFVRPNDDDNLFLIINSDAHFNFGHCRNMERVPPVHGTTYRNKQKAK